MTGGPPAGSVPHVLVAAVADRTALDDARLHHLRRVRRVRTGDPLTVTDGRGRWAEAALADDDMVVLRGEIREVPAPSPPVTVAFALTKGDAPEDLVQKLTELGVDRIVPFVAERSVVRWNADKAARVHQRLRAIAEGALEQSHRCWLAEVDAITDTAAVAAMGAARADFDGAWPTLAPSVIAIGPEGGWSDAERALLPQSVRLATNVLRSGTAAVTAGALLTSLRAGIVAEHPNF